jgi:TIR domain
MAYEHDVFLSYKSDFPFGDWVHECFLPFFRPYVENALNRPFNLFLDRTGIMSGDSWPQRLLEALSRSRCLVAVWSPFYFRSDWCRRECELMLHRERRLGMRSLANPGGLVLPICLFDGDHFPGPAKEIQHLDCRKYFVVGDGFKRTELYVEFQQVIARWSEEVASAIHRAPPWRKEWSSRQWHKDVAIDLRLGGRTVSFSGLE